MQVARDTITPNWVFAEDGFVAIGGKEWNSGYPSDPKCKEWMTRNLQDKVGACEEPHECVMKQLLATYKAQ